MESWEVCNTWVHFGHSGTRSLDPWWPINRPWVQLVASGQEFIVGVGIESSPSRERRAQKPTEQF